jgi:dihydroorotate dehydrogenase electron transfer subunit
MAQQRQLVIADQRAVTPRLRWLTLHAPDLARGVQAGQYLLVRCAEQGSYDPLLRRPLFIAAAEPALGQIGLLYEPSERGLVWLSRGHAGDTLDVIGPLGRPFALDGRTSNLLLVGSGPGLAALMLLARAGAPHGAVTLIAGADDSERLPPPFLLPGEVEYQTVIGQAIDLVSDPDTSRNIGTEADKATRRQGDKAKKRNAPSTPSPRHPVSSSPISWADQIFAALPSEQLLALRESIRQVKYRWERGFAAALLEGPIVCGVGACGVCAVELRRGPRLLCADGPVFDLRDVSDLV